MSKMPSRGENSQDMFPYYILQLSLGGKVLRKRLFRVVNHTMTIAHFKLCNYVVEFERSKTNIIIAFMNENYNRIGFSSFKWDTNL